MQALGFVETKGFVAAIESADAMLKAAKVNLLERTFVKGGIVAITITGDVAACKASVDAAVVAVERMGGTLLSTHVIPRPADTLKGLIVGSGELIEEEDKEIPEEKQEETLFTVLEKSKEDQAVVLEKPEINRKFVEGFIETNGTERMFSRLKRARAWELKEMISNEYPEIDMGEDTVMNLTKREMLNWLKKFYKC